jgi:hypothetical protein|tara:strand:+ start:472 stop:711 length:240 start_codon:yes stop_codon:yes gene_type:complete
MERTRNGDLANVLDDPTHTNASLPQCFARSDVDVDHGTTAKGYGMKENRIGKASGMGSINSLNFSALNSLVYALAKTFE